MNHGVDKKKYQRRIYKMIWKLSTRFASTVRKTKLSDGPIRYGQWCQFPIYRGCEACRDHTAWLGNCGATKKA